jgi:hypothetical protein
MGSEDLVVERETGKRQVQRNRDADSGVRREAWRDERQRIKPQRQVKVDVLKILQGTSYRC